MTVLAWLIGIPLIGGLLAWLSERWGAAWPRWIALAALAADLGVLLWLWAGTAGALEVAPGGQWLAELVWAWIPRFGIDFRLALDGLGLVLVALTLFLGLTAIVSAWSEIRDRVGAFHLNLLWTLAGAIGVFMALDLFLFFLFWEVMLVPMFFVIALWGHEERLRAAIKFMIFTQGSGLLLLTATIALVLLHREATGILTFAYPELLGSPIAPDAAFWLMLGFFVAFAVKLPAIPVHTWLPDAHTEAPTAGSVVLAGVLLKTGAYGLVRFVVPLFPDAALDFAPVAMALGVAGILYGAVLAFAQADAKRLVAYTSVSHLGFVLLGVFAWNAHALQGAVMQMLAHGISTGALFILVGALQERLGTRDMGEMSGLWMHMPRLAAIGLFFAIASLGLPGLGNFVGEFLVLLGAYRVNVAATAVALAGLVLATIYALALVQRVFHGPGRQAHAGSRDLDPGHLGTMTAMMLVSLWLGLYPQPVFDSLRPALVGLDASVTGVIGAPEP